MLKVLLVMTMALCVCSAADSARQQSLPVRFSYSYGFQQRPTLPSKRSHEESDEPDESTRRLISSTNSDHDYDEREGSIQNKIPYGVPLSITPISGDTHGLFALTFLTYPYTSVPQDSSNTLAYALAQPSSLISSVLQPNSFAHFTYSQPTVAHANNGGARHTKQ